ncbi:GTPase HflX [candidate division KSB1 bacterium]|nr:GTPase HflX [candidate division KSB1 bacterium]
MNNHYLFEDKSAIAERAILVGVVRSHETLSQVEEYLNELEQLAETAGALTVDRLIQKREHIDAAFLIGKGKVEELKARIEAQPVDVVIFDEDLTPAQVKNIGRICEVKILDRSGLILDIFARRARTWEAKTQVELAQLRYLLPRLTRQWTHLSRQVGGIGTKGPGETQLEVDRRRIRQRIRSLKEELKQIEKEQIIRRQRRDGFYKVALIGYTNVGKSTLLNVLTAADVLVENRLFATLDPTVRSLQVNDHQAILLIDTVGFIRKLPHDLVASFRSTLAEAAEADLLLHVIDLSHPQYAEQIVTVNEVLKTLNIADRPQLMVFNKVDQLPDPAIITQVSREYPAAIFISAARGMFLEKLSAELQRLAESEQLEIEVKVPIANSELVARIHRMVKVLERRYEAEQVILKIRGENWKVHQIITLTEQGV